MSLRALTREQSDFAVRFVNCGGVMVRQRLHIATEDRIRVNEIYQVKWNREEYASAVILGSGDYAAMSALVEKRTPVSIRGPNPTAPTPPLVSPFTPARPTHTSSHLGPVMSALAAIGSAVTSIQKNLDTLNKKVDTGLRRLTELEVMHKRLASQQDQILARQHRPTIPAAVVDDQQVPAIPDLYNLPNEELTRIKISAKKICGCLNQKVFFQNCTAWTTCATSTTGMVVESMEA
ncbi:unnamed protein product [Mytilus coruscus]|uniref:Uncharacterized protein n=1 Tax=Mytilus coruscus TaxID=42192 RepID=A0A6J8EXZ2_MYTCO|nr:unnamed protein product [Mytilus coruscus]